MDGIRANLQGEVDTILGSFLDRAAAIDALSKASCGEADLAAVETKYAAVANAAIAAGAAPVNKEVQATIALVRNELAACVGALGKLELFIALSTPVIEDGGNFGVSVQAEVKKNLSEYRAALKASMGAYAEYYKARADAADKCTVKSSTSKTTKSESKSDDTKDGAKEAKASTSSSSEEVASSKAAPGPDAIAHLVTLDVDMYFKLQQQCAGVLEIYLVASDLVEKNRAKTFAPRGEGSNPMTMF